MKSVLLNRQGLKVAVIVNDMSEINIDAKILSSSEIQISRQDEKLVEMSNGCICCTLREDLLTEIERLASENKYDYLLIESTGISEPMPVAETFYFEDESGKKLDDLARLDTLVTVVDAKNFLAELDAADYLTERDLGLDEEDERTIADLLIEQVEFANVLIVNKTDLISKEQTDSLKEVLKKLNSSATILDCKYGAIAPNLILNTGSFRVEQTAEHGQWMQSSLTEKPSESDEFGITSFVYRTSISSRAFSAADREKMMELFDQRSILGSRPDSIGVWSQAGGCAQHTLKDAGLQVSHVRNGISTQRKI